MTEIRLRNGETIIVDVSYEEMIGMWREAQRKRLMLNVFDIFSQRRFAFFPDAVSYMTEKRE